MQKFQKEPGRPIYSLQEFLRVIAQVNGTFPTLIPDGIYGEQTEAVVVAFQKEYGLSQTGEVDNDTWDKIIEEYSKAVVYTLPPPTTSMFPSSMHVIRAGDRADFHYPIQAMILAISKRFDNIDGFEISDVHGADVVKTTKQLQSLMANDCNGEIDIKCWQELSRMYENLVSKDIFRFGELQRQKENRADSQKQNQIMPERYVDMSEINEDISRQNMMQPENTGREGVITPRLDAYNIRDNQMGQTAVPIPVNEQSDNEATQAQRDNINNATDMQNNVVLDKDDAQNTNPAQMMRPKNPSDTRTKREPLRWDFR